MFVLIQFVTLFVTEVKEGIKLVSNALYVCIAVRLPNFYFSFPVLVDFSGYDRKSSLRRILRLIFRLLQ